MTTNTIPHPADALPLPDLSYDDCVSVLGQPTVNDLQLFLNDYIRAAHREGYELAMSMRAAPLSRDQIDKIMTKHYPLDSLLRESVDAFEACVRDIEAALAAPAQEQPAFKIYKGDVCYKSAEEDQSFGMWCPVSTAYQPTFPEGTEFYATAQPKQQQAGAVVSDEQISDLWLMSVDCVGLPRDKAISFARAVLALSQGGK